jgi:hypothetical protein
MAHLALALARLARAAVKGCNMNIGKQEMQKLERSKTHLSPQLHDELPQLAKLTGIPYRRMP